MYAWVLREPCVPLDVRAMSLSYFRSKTFVACANLLIGKAYPYYRSYNVGAHRELMRGDQIASKQSLNTLALDRKRILSQPHGRN